MFAAEGIGRFVGDRYHVVRELGRGGMGVVYLGRDLRRDMDVAIKFRGVTHHNATLWLKREFRAVASLRHPNLVELYELVAHGDSCYFTMEYLPGVDPRRWVERPPATPPLPAPIAALSERTTQSALPIQEAHTEISATTSTTAPTTPTVRALPQVDFGRVRAVLAQLAEGLAFLHAHGVIHRDVKPSNAIVCDGVVKLLDFGLALDHRRAEHGLSREDRVVGTAAYLAPEYVERLIVSPAMDVYALGVVAFELVTGGPPFGGAMHVLSRLNRVVSLPRASTLNPELPRELDDLIDAMLQQDPAKRPSALDIAERLNGELSQPRQLRRASRFVGRDGELHRLTARLADPGSEGRLVLVTGPSGVGKSSLIEEAVGRARLAEGSLDDITWRGRCHERERVPYRAFDFVIDDLATELAGNAGLVSRIEHAGALARVFPALGALLEDAARTPAAEDLRVERERALVAITELFRHVIALPRGPKSTPGTRGILVIDDLQWADDDSLELLALLVERIARPLTIIATWTTGKDQQPPPHELLERLGARADVIELAPMAAQDLEVLISDLAPLAPIERLHAAAELAAGSPYLAELIGRELADAGLADPHHAEVRRLERLADNERTIAEIASLAGAAATFEQLRALSELPSVALQSALRGLEDGRIVRSTPTASGDSVYVFYHQRLRDAASSALTPAARRKLHRRFAVLLEHERATPDQLAYHWAEAGEATEAVRWAIRAAEAAQAQLAWGLAANSYGRALELAEPAARRELRAKRAEALFLGGKLAAAAADFDELARAEPSGDGDRWHVRAAESRIKLGEIDRGLEILDGVLERRGERRARGRARSTLRALGVTARWLVPSRLREATSVLRRDSDEVVTAAYRVIASFLSTPYPLESFEYVVRGIAVAERAGDRAAESMGMAMLAAYLAAGSLGRFGDRAIATAQRLSIESGAPYPRMVVAGAAGILATLRGNWSGMRIAHEEGRQNLHPARHRAVVGSLVPANVLGPRRALRRRARACAGDARRARRRERRSDRARDARELPRPRTRGGRHGSPSRARARARARRRAGRAARHGLDLPPGVRGRARARGGRLVARRRAGRGAGAHRAPAVAVGDAGGVGDVRRRDRDRRDRARSRRRARCCGARPRPRPRATSPRQALVLRADRAAAVGAGRAAARRARSRPRAVRPGPGGRRRARRQGRSARDRGAGRCADRSGTARVCGPVGHGWRGRAPTNGSIRHVRR